MKRIQSLLVFIFFGFFVLGFAATDTFAQRNEEHELTEGARKDGFEVSEERGKLYVQARNVFDPISKERLEGLEKLRIVCKDSEKRELQQLVEALFEAGSTNRIRTPCKATSERTVLLVVVLARKIEP